MYSKGGSPVLSEEALEVCGWKGCVVGGDSCALLGQVAELVVVGCSATSSANCRSVAADVMPASPIPVFRFGEYGGLVVFVVGVGVGVMIVSWASPVSVWVWRVLQTLSHCRCFQHSICHGFVLMIWDWGVALGNLSIGQVCYGLCDRTECWWRLRPSHR